MNSVGRTLWRTANRGMVWLYRTSKGRLGARSRGGSPVMILTVRGRRSGKPFSVPVARFERSGGWLVVGSAGGLPQEPQWFKNLRAASDAQVEIGDRRHQVAVHVLSGPERDEAFAHVLSVNPAFADYESKAGRPMPVALLVPQ